MKASFIVCDSVTLSLAGTSINEMPIISQEFVLMSQQGNPRTSLQ
jgi:hypothetical protein